MGWAARVNKSAEISAANGHRKPRVVTWASRRDARMEQVPTAALLLGALSAPRVPITGGVPTIPITPLLLVVRAAFERGRGVEKSTTLTGANRAAASCARVQQMKSPMPPGMVGRLVDEVANA